MVHCSIFNSSQPLLQESNFLSDIQKQVTSVLGLQFLLSIIPNLPKFTSSCYRLSKMGHRNHPGSVNDELFRLSTSSCYNGQCSRVRLARAGFYCTSSHDVRCYLCDFSKDDWNFDDEPLVVHRNASPNCTFFSRNDEINVPVSYEFIEIMRYAAETVGRGGVICDQPPADNRSLRRGGPPGAHLDLAPTRANLTSNEQTLQGNSGLVRSTMAAIVRENRELRRRLRCELCQTIHRCVVFMPCGHLIACLGCASRMEQRCPICRSDISYMIKVENA